MVEQFLLADVHADWDRDRALSAGWYHRDGLLLAIPMPDADGSGDLWRVMADVPVAEQRLDSAQIVARFERLLRERAGATGVRIRDTVWTSVFRIHRRLADDYRRGRVLLAGDAAHIHSPIGGQGMNTGIGDAENLSWKLALAVRGRAGEALLDTYTAERRSLPAREAILRAARARFGADGYDRATVRAIAADADIDPSMVMRYFGSKRQLFALAADFDLRLPDLDAAPRDRVGHVLAAHLLDRWEYDDGLKILLRTAAADDDAAERMRTIFAGQLTPLVAGLVDDPAAATTRAGLVSTQALGLALCRYVLRLPPVVAMTPAELVDSFGPTLQRYLVGSPWASVAALAPLKGHDDHLARLDRRAACP